MREITIERGGNVKHGCHTGCVIQCSRYWVDKDGHYKTKGMEYESVWSLGANCGIGDLDEVAELDRACGDIGVDTIEMGATLAVYMESGAIEFGDAAGALAALKEVGTDSELGDDRSATAPRPSARSSASTRIPVVKHQAMPAYDPRPIQGIGVTYATSTMGADHTAGYAITANILGVGGTVDPLKPEGQVALSQGLQIATAMLDAMGLCIFVAFAVLDKPEAFEAISEMATAHTGKDWDVDELMLLGKKDAHLRAALQRARPASPPPTTVCRRTCTPRSCRRTTWSSRCPTPSSTRSTTSCRRRPLAWASRAGVGSTRPAGMPWMRIELALFASLVPYLPDGDPGSGGSVAPDRRPRRDDRRRGRRAPRAGRRAAHHLRQRRGVHRRDVVLADGDRLAIFPPVAGG